MFFQTEIGVCVCLCHRDGNDLISVKGHAVNAEHAVSGFEISDDAAVIDDQPVILGAFHVQIAVVPGTVGNLRGGKHGFAGLADVGRGEGMARCDVVGAVCPAALRPHEMIDAVSLQHAGSLDITVGGDGLEDLTVLKNGVIYH